ncbi:MAG: formate dehydrogenase accessory sulfurtransferase FdhD [Vicinamibacterales bacterium]
MSQAVAAVPIVRIRDGQRVDAIDHAAGEVPLEIRVGNRPFAVVMRTPGADAALVAGFLLGERLVRGSGDLALIEHCTDPVVDAGDAANIITVRLDADAEGRAATLLAHRREVMATAACGVCGRLTLDSMREGLAPLAAGLQVSAALIQRLPVLLREGQALFEATGGLHAAGIFDRAGARLALAEDVGRHNAVDKVVGALLLRDGLPASDAVLCVSGRTSYEIVQKAWCAGIPIVVSVSAPSSLAVSLADEAGMTLAGFVRGGGLNIYAHPARIT